MSGPWCDAPVVNAAADAGGVIEVVPTEDYEAKKGPGVAAPSPGHECVYVYPWPADTYVYWRSRIDAEWSEVDRPPDGEAFNVRPGEAIRVVSPPGIRVQM